MKKASSLIPAALTYDLKLQAHGTVPHSTRLHTLEGIDIMAPRFGRYVKSTLLFPDTAILARIRRPRVRIVQESVRELLLPQFAGCSYLLLLQAKGDDIRCKNSGTQLTKMLRKLLKGSVGMALT